MVVAYNFLLKKIAATLDSKENLKTVTLASRLNLRQDELRDLLNIMERKGDIKCIKEVTSECGGGCKGCSKICADQRQNMQGMNVKSYKLTEKGKAVCK